MKRLRSFLRQHGVPSRGLRSAIVDMPALLTDSRRALWCALTGEMAPPHLTVFSDYLHEIYTTPRDHPNAWVRTDTRLVQRALHLVRDAAERGNSRGVDVAQLARTLGVSRTDVIRLGGDLNCKGSTSARFRGVLVRDELNPSLLRLRPCPHPDCVAPHGERWLSHYLPVPETDGYNGLLCPDCRRLPDLERPAVYFPDSHFDQAWSGPHNARNWDLTTRPATQAVGSAEMSTRLADIDCDYSIIEFAERLGVTDASVRAWIKREVDPLPARRVTSRGGAKYAIAASELARVEGSQEHHRLLRASPRPQAVEGDVITLRELAQVTGVAEHYLRARAINGDLGPIEYRNLTGTGAAHLVVQGMVVNLSDPAAGTPRLPAEWIRRHRLGLLTIGKAATRAGTSAHVLRSAVASGDLMSLVTDGGTHRFDPAELDRWAEDRGRYPLTPLEAVAHAGVTTEVLRRAVQRGEVSAVTTAGGHRRYAVADLDAWRAKSAHEDAD